jgi:hypothetical protein
MDTVSAALLINGTDTDDNYICIRSCLAFLRLT